MKRSRLEISGLARLVFMPDRVIAVLFLLFLGAVAGRAAQQEVFPLTGLDFANGVSLTASSQGLLPAASSYSYQISGTISGRGAFSGVNNGNPKDFGAFLNSIQMGFSANLSGVVQNPSGTLPFTILSGATISGHFPSIPFR